MNEIDSPIRSADGGDPSSDRFSLTAFDVVGPGASKPRASPGHRGDVGSVEARQRHAEGRPVADGALDGDGSTVSGDNRLTDG